MRFLLFCVLYLFLSLSVHAEQVSFFIEVTSPICSQITSLYTRQRVPATEITFFARVENTCTPSPSLYFSSINERLNYSGVTIHGEETVQLGINTSQADCITLQVCSYGSCVSEALHITQNHSQRMIITETSSRCPEVREKHLNMTSSFSKQENVVVYTSTAVKAHNGARYGLLLVLFLIILWMFWKKHGDRLWMKKKSKN